jgi:hypothetical protein
MSSLSNPRHPGNAVLPGREPIADEIEIPESDLEPVPPGQAGSPELARSLAELKGHAQFILYLADQIEDSLIQLAQESEAGHQSFLCKVLAMYSTQLENKHQGLGDKIAETCQEVYITLREHDAL